MLRGVGAAPGGSAVPAGWRCAAAGWDVPPMPSFLHQSLQRHQKRHQIRHVRAPAASAPEYGGQRDGATVANPRRWVLTVRHGIGKDGLRRGERGDAPPRRAGGGPQTRSFTSATSGVRVLVVPGSRLHRSIPSSGEVKSGEVRSEVAPARFLAVNPTALPAHWPAEWFPADRAAMHPREARWAWRLLGGNNRELGRSSRPYGSVAECAAAIDRLRTSPAGLVASLAADPRSGHWYWETALDGQSVAVAPRAFRWRRDCEHNFAQFATSLPVATLDFQVMPAEIPAETAAAADGNPIDLRGPALPAQESRSW